MNLRLGYYTDATAAGAAFVGVTPNRDLDTRNGTGGINGKVGPHQTITLMVAGVGGVPGLASSTPPTAVVINVTVTNHNDGYSWLTVWPHGSPMPNASDVNFVGGQTVPNLVVVRVGTNGEIDINNANGSTDIIVDVFGYYTQTS